MSSSQSNLVVMFADVSGSVSLYERLRDTEALHAVDRCLKRMTRSLEGYGGKVLQMAGDELLITFRSAEEACQAAIDMQQRVADLPPAGGGKLGIRIGMHIGKQAFPTDNLPASEVVRNAARICGTAQRDQILCSAQVLEALPPDNAISADRAPNPDGLREAGSELSLSQIYWPAPPALNASDAAFSYTQSEIGGLDAALPSERICVRYRGKAYLLDDKTPVLTMGRDKSNELIVEDPKASRLHARLELRSDGYHLIDSSTNGTFVTLRNQREVFLRREEIFFNISGRIAFGTSKNDPNAEIAEVEYL